MFDDDDDLIDGIAETVGDSITTTHTMTGWGVVRLLLSIAVLVIFWIVVKS